MNCRIGEIARIQSGIIFQDLRGIDAVANQGGDMGERNTRALEYRLAFQDIGVGNDPPAASAIGHEIVGKMAAETFHRHMEHKIAAVQNEIRSFGTPSAGGFRSTKHQLAQ